MSSAKVPEYGIVGMLVGVIIAAQLTWPELNLGISVAELRPAAPAAHQRGDLRVRRLRAVCHQLPRGATHLPDAAVPARLAMFTFWGWNLVILAAVITLPLGMTQGKEYAELEWPIDLLIAVVWVAYAIVFFGTVGTRKVRHIYVANWFFGAFILAVALLHIVNSAAIPVSLTKSYSRLRRRAGRHGAVVVRPQRGGLLPDRGLPGDDVLLHPQAGRPPGVQLPPVDRALLGADLHLHVGGPHHLHYTALPDWAQSVGMIFSLVLLAPSWGGMINGIMTLSGAWHKLRDDPILKFLIVSLSFYGMSTFEGPMMSIKTVNALSHYTDWTVGHVHSGALGWVGMISMGSLYYLIPRMFGRKKMYSVKAIELHFWIATIGIVLYIAAMWIAGVMQGLMWRAVNPDGTLVYSFVESVKATFPFYVMRLLRRPAVPERHADHGLERVHDRQGRQGRRAVPIPAGGRPTPEPQGENINMANHMPHVGHEKIETSNFLMIVLILLAVWLSAAWSRSCRCSSSAPPRSRSRASSPTPRCSWPGRDVYIREGCYNCHSQMVRPFRAETLRYGSYSRPASSSTTTPSSGAASAPGPTCTAWAASTATNGTACT
jgi:cytochrome c oxidase cbb3-type subunit 1